MSYLHDRIKPGTDYKLATRIEIKKIQSYCHSNECILGKLILVFFNIVPYCS